MTSFGESHTIPQLLQEVCSLGDHPAVVDGPKTLTYEELQRQTHRVAKAFLATDVGRGDRIALWAPNRIEFILAVLGAQSIGAAVVPLNTRFTGHESLTILQRSRASILVVADGFLGLDYSQMLQGAASSLDDEESVQGALPSLKLIVGFDSLPTMSPATTWESFLDEGQSTSDDELHAALTAVTPDDVMDILYTSGTTGVPKGVMSSHKQTIGVARAWAMGADLTPDDRYAVVNPLFHGFGYKAGMISSLVAGATIYPVLTFVADDLLDLIQREKISVLPGVPTIFTTLIDHPHLKDYDLSSLRFAIAGATAAPETLFRDMVHILGFKRVAQAYGLTECVVATMSRPGESLDHAQETTGPAVEGIEIRIVDESGRELPVGEDGEIIIRGDNVMLGYFEDEAATKAVTDSDGWFHSGDIGRMDEHGCVKITDRLKDMFIVGGFNVYPAEVENVLRKHPAVNESAVIGTDDARLGTVGRAYVALLHGVTPKPGAKELEEFCRERLANFKVPRDFVFVENFPRNATGKILKSELRNSAHTAEATL